MQRQQQIVYLSEEQLETLIADGSITVGNQTVEYDDDDIYVTPQKNPYVKPVTGIPPEDLAEQYVKTTDYATSSKAGIVKVGNGLFMSGTGIHINTAPANVIKAGSNIYAPITPSNQDTSTFYGLAKAAGDATQAQSNNTVGTYTDEAKAAIREMIGATALDNIPEAPVQDIQVNEASIVQNGTANIQIGNGLQYANNELKIKTDAYAPIFFNTGAVRMAPAVDSAIKDPDANYGHNTKAIVPLNQHKAAFYGLAKAAGDTTQSQSNNAVGTYTDEAKAAIQNMLDVPSNAEVTNAIGTAIGNVHQFDIEVVQELPTTNIKEHTIYFVSKTGETNDIYDEYIRVNNGWELIGNTQIDLSNYIQDVQINGTTIVQNGIANIPYATANAAGVVKATPTLGMTVNQAGYIAMIPASDSDIRYWSTSTRTITPATQHSAVFYGLARAAGDLTQPPSENPVGTYTEEAKTAIKSMLGVPTMTVVKGILSISDIVESYPNAEEASF